MMTAKIVTKAGGFYIEGSSKEDLIQAAELTMDSNNVGSHSNPFDSNIYEKSGKELPKIKLTGVKDFNEKVDLTMKLQDIYKKNARI